MRAVPRECHKVTPQKLDRAQKRRERKRITEDGRWFGDRYLGEDPNANPVRTDECAAIAVFDLAEWAGIENRRKIGILESMGFNVEHLDTITVRTKDTKMGRMIEYTQPHLREAPYDPGDDCSLIKQIDEWVEGGLHGE
jgi:hypothetical protein